MPSGDNVWWSRAGNDFGCAAAGGHNLDISLPALADVPAGTPVTMSFKSRWDIEWDFDYGFVLGTHGRRQELQVLRVGEGLHDAEGENPHNMGCQAEFGNGLTGTSGSYGDGTQEVDRIAGNYKDAPFLDDAYDIYDAGGQGLRRAVQLLDRRGPRPPGLVHRRPRGQGRRPGDLRARLRGDRGPRHLQRRLPRGPARPRRVHRRLDSRCRPRTARRPSTPTCIEMRDRSGFDFYGRGENDRGAISFEPGLLLAYTDENHGYGNAGTDDPPAQSPLDSQPQEGEQMPNLDDAAFTSADGDSHFSRQHQRRRRCGQL